VQVACRLGLAVQDCRSVVRFNAFEDEYRRAQSSAGVMAKVKEYLQTQETSHA
jgi:hypothetical protein